MTDLTTRLEQATIGSRELSDEVLLALGGVHHYSDIHSHGYYIDFRDERYYDDAPNPTLSVDDCLKLVPEGWKVLDVEEFENGSWNVELYNNTNSNSAAAQASTLALAFSIALVKAHEHGS